MAVRHLLRVVVAKCSNCALVELIYQHAKRTDCILTFPSYTGYFFLLPPDIDSMGNFGLYPVNHLCVLSVLHQWMKERKFYCNVTKSFSYTETNQITLLTKLILDSYE